MDGAVGVSAFGRRFRYGWFWLEPYFWPTGVPAASQVLVPEITPICPLRESVLTVALRRGVFATCIVYDPGPVVDQDAHWATVAAEAGEVRRTDAATRPAATAPARADRAVVRVGRLTRRG